MSPLSGGRTATDSVDRVDATTLICDGVAHHAAGRFAQAIAAYAQAVALAPDDARPWRLLGVAALQTGEIEAARGLIERALRIDPGDAAACAALGNIEELAGNRPAALAAYRIAHDLDPGLAVAGAGRARVALQTGAAAEAIAVAEDALARGCAEASLLVTLGAARLETRDYAGAAAASLAAVRAAAHADAFANLGAACIHLGKAATAIQACEAALQLDPAHAQAANNLGIALKARGSLAAAEAAFARSSALGSDEARINLGTTQLLLGDYAGGWPNYGWITAERRSSAPFRALPLWDGRPLERGRLLIWPEQGIGDTLQFGRFLPQVRARVAALTLACPPGTRDVLVTSAGIDAVIPLEPAPVWAGFDAWLPTIRLPVVCDARPETLPPAAYLAADPRRVARLRPQLIVPGTLRVGLVWSGNPDFRWNAVRSCRLAELDALSAVEGVSWFALQHGSAAGEARHSRLPLIPINAACADFADTAAVIAQLDLVLSVDTSVAHLAGALGCPAWIMLSNQPDWRWQQTGPQTPWYPTLRLFRQDATGGWAPVVAALTAALRAAVESARV